MKQLKNRKPRILFYDVENSANEVYTWGGRLYDLSAIKVKKHYELLSYSYQWEGERKVHCVTREGQRTDKQLIRSLVRLLNQADIVISHNGIDSDHRKTRTRAIFHRVDILKDLSDVDTLRTARSKFMFNGNSLGDLAQFLGVGKKLKHPGFDMWTGCLEEDDPRSWRFMARYNRHDVRLLRAVYKVLRPYISNHPNVSRILNPGTQELAVCPTCGSNKVNKRGFYFKGLTPRRDWACVNPSCRRRFTTRILKSELNEIRERLTKFGRIA